MRRLTFVLCALLIVSSLAGAAFRKRNMLNSRLAEVVITTKLDLHTIDDMGGLIDNVKGSTARVYLLPEDYDELRARGFSVTWVEPERVPEVPLDFYHLNADIASAFAAHAVAYPTLFSYESIGNSVQGRPIYAAKISDNVTQDEAEIEVKYIAAMHGDELVGTENCMKFIDTLLTGYGVDPVLTGMLQDYEIYIIPAMNPDGRAVGSLGQRTNASGIDLNRDFPDRINDSTNTTAGRAVETQHVMNWSAGRNFVLAANYHGGALVANYPWDGSYNGQSVFTPTPENTLFHQLSLTYSLYNNEMYNGDFAPDGTVNGADWYHINGGMQDWNYVWMGCKEITLEISDVKSGPESALDSLWRTNRQSMTEYLLQAREGVRGIVTDAETGLPVRANIMLAAIPYLTYSSALHGEYYRILVPGTYSLTFSAPGYVSQAINNIVVVDGTPTVLNVALSPAPRAEIVLTPNTFSETVPLCDTHDVNLTISNPGDLALNWSSSEALFQETYMGAALGPWRWIDSREPDGPVFNWKDISAIGTQLTFPANDSNLGPYALGFTFPFYGTNFTQLRVSANGWISFTSSISNSYSYSNQSLPGASTTPENLLAIWWDDLNPTIAGSNVRIWTNNADSAVVSFQSVPSFSGGGLYNFEVILESNGRVTYQYGSMGTSRLNSSTIGMQNAGRTRGITVNYNSIYIADNTAIKFCPSQAVQTIPVSGTVPIGGQQVVTLRLSSCCLPDGPTLSNLLFTSNAALTPQLTLPVTIDAGGFIPPDPSC
jgi:hypothetical protein